MRAAEVLTDPLRNRDSAFSEIDRDALGLRGLLPWRVMKIDEQVDLEVEHLRRKSDDLERYIGLAALQDRNETLFYRLLSQHLDELAPIVYTPTVGMACAQFSHILRRPRGLWITPDDVERVPQLLRNPGRADVRLVVVTDNERILGLGDQGAGGMGIPIGKLALYTAGAGIHPARTLPISLDVGTDNEALLSDPEYLGFPRRRLRGPEYDAFIDAFVNAVHEVFPNAVLQWEDFKQHNAIRLLDRYRERIVSFNDDIQGTAAVGVGGLLAALRLTGEEMCRQRVVIMGAGAAGIGIARLLETVLHDAGMTAPEVRRAVILFDSHGLVYEGRPLLDNDKRPHALPSESLEELGLVGIDTADLARVVRAIAPTVLIGVSGVAGAFTEQVVREMASRVPTPVVLPLSNPTSAAEATPADVLRWSAGRAVVATGSPFDPVVYDGRTHVVGQANNMFVFPRMGLGAIASRARQITDRMFLVAARELSNQVSDARLGEGALYPPLSDLRRVSRAIAVRVACEARGSGVAPDVADADLDAAIDDEMWVPAYE